MNSNNSFRYIPEQLATREDLPIITRLNNEFGSLISGIQNQEIAGSLIASWRNATNNYNSLSEKPDAVTNQLEKLLKKLKLSLDLQTSQGIVLASTKSASNDSKYDLAA